MRKPYETHLSVKVKEWKLHPLFRKQQQSEPK